MEAPSRPEAPRRNATVLVAIAFFLALVVMLGVFVDRYFFGVIAVVGSGFLLYGMIHDNRRVDRTKATDEPSNPQERAGWPGLRRIGITPARRP